MPCDFAVREHAGCQGACCPEGAGCVEDALVEDVVVAEEGVGAAVKCQLVSVERGEERRNVRYRKAGELTSCLRRARGRCGGLSCRWEEDMLVHPDLEF